MVRMNERKKENRGSSHSSGVGVMAGVGLMVVLVLAGAVSHGVAEGTPLDEYVWLPDASYEWQVVGTKRGDGYTQHTLELTSQTWLTTREVDRPVWRHWLLIVVPDTVRHRTVALWADGGSNGGTPPADAFVLVTDLARNTATVTAELRMIPNQPLQFSDENSTRYEDALIAYTWDKFLRTKEPNWILQLPMAKSTVRAMDAIQEFLPSIGLAADNFILAGASKRGWTVYLGAIVDQRVIGVAPIVIDVPNLIPVFNHHYQCYGRWAAALKDYQALNLMGWLNTPDFQDLANIIDPYEYRERLTIPKYIMAATGDEFFIPDNSKFYFHEFQGSKYLRYFPNCEHSMAGHLEDARRGMEAWLQMVVYNWPQPKFTWTVEEGTRKITVRTETEVESVWVWQVTNPRTRNFMLWATWPDVWRATRLAPVDAARTTYEAAISAPAPPGYTAFFVELRYRTPAHDTNPDAPLLRFTTDTSVVPDVYPFGPCGVECSCMPDNCPPPRPLLDNPHSNSNSNSNDKPFHDAQEAVPLLLR